MPGVSNKKLVMLLLQPFFSLKWMLVVTGTFIGNNCLNNRRNGYVANCFEQMRLPTSEIQVS